MKGGATMQYKDTIQIRPYRSTVWLIEFSNGKQHLAIWHKDAEIDDIVVATKVHYPNRMFKVTNVDVGEFEISKILHSLSNGRGVNQNMEVVL